MAKTIDQLRKEYAPKKTARRPDKEDVDASSLPFWVVVLSKKPNPDGSPRFKFVFGFATEAEADVECQNRQTEDDLRAHQETASRKQHAKNVNEGRTSPESPFFGLPPVPVPPPVEPFVFAVVKRPPGGVL